MSKPSAPDPPDYAAAAKAQGVANVGSAVASNFLNQANQIGPYGSQTYSYDYKNAPTIEGQRIPRTTVTTLLSPAQQKLLDQQTGISTQLNDLASQGIGYVGDAVGQPISQDNLPDQVTNLGDGSDGVALRDRITDAMMERLRPTIERDRAALDVRLANQGITHGSEAYGSDFDTFNRGVNDQRIAALIAGGQEQQSQFQRGLAGGQFTNAARGQAIQEADYFRNAPLNMLNALRSGGQVNLPQFGNVSAGNSIAAAPVYQASQDQYAAAMQNYQSKLQQQNAMMQGIAGIGSSAIMASDRRLKRAINYLFTRADDLKVYLFKYLWSDAWSVGVMADEVAILRPEALGPTVQGYATVNYGKL